MADLLTKEEQSGECPRCRHWRLYPSHCNCKRFEVCIPWRDAEGDWTEVYAMDAEDAAEEYAETCDSDGDYTIIKRGSGEVWTRDEAGAIQKWDIEAEAVPSYSAREKR